MHDGQVPSWPPCQPTPTRAPGATLVTPAPSASTTPAISCPGARGRLIPGQAFWTVNMSLWHTPQASTRSRTCPGPGSGTGSSTSSSEPGVRTCIARIVAMTFP